MRRVAQAFLADYLVHNWFASPGDSISLLSDMMMKYLIYLLRYGMTAEQPQLSHGSRRYVVAYHWTRNALHRSYPG